MPNTRVGRRSMRVAMLVTCGMLLAAPMTGAAAEAGGQAGVEECGLKNTLFCGPWARSGRMGGGDIHVTATRITYGDGTEMTCRVLDEDTSSERSYSVLDCLISYAVLEDLPPEMQLPDEQQFIRLSVVASGSLSYLQLHKSERLACLFQTWLPKTFEDFSQFYGCQLDSFKEAFYRGGAD